MVAVRFPCLSVVGDGRRAREPMGMGIASSSRLPLPSLLFFSACSPGLQHTRVVRARTDRVVRLAGAVRCSDGKPSRALRTCKNCKQQFDPTLNHARACRFHTAHFGGETKRKFESVYTGGTMNTPDSGRVFQYWHCCGSEDPFDAGCTAAPHCSYDE